MPETQTQVQIRPAVGAADLDILRHLLRDYASHLAQNPAGAAGICIQNYEAELRNLPTPYTTLLLAEVAGAPAGCVALKTIQRPGEIACEMKRLWVGDDFRGLGLGRRLVAAVLETAQAAGYTAMYLDTVPAAMPQANRLYASLGFEPVDRYNDNPVDDVVFFRRSL